MSEESAYEITTRYINDPFSLGFVRGSRDDIPPRTVETPSYPVTNNNGYSSGQYLSRSSSNSTVVPGYNNPVDRSLSTDTTKR